MDTIYREYGVQTDRACAKCLKWMVLYMEVDVPYYRCVDSNCNNLELIEDDEMRKHHSRLPAYLEDNEALHRRDMRSCFMIMGLFHAQEMELSIKADEQVTFTAWARRFQESEGDQSKALSMPELLPQIWNSNLMSLVRAAMRKHRLLPNPDRKSRR